MLRRLLLIASVLAVAVLSGCHKPKQPSPYYEEASRAFNDLYAEKLDDAYVDPRMDAIEDKLKQVPSDSLDYEPARTLIDRIDKGRAEQQAQAKAAEAQPESPPPEPVFDEAPAEAQPDAGPSQPVAGMPKTEFLSRFSDCFESQGSVAVRAADGGAVPGNGEMFALSDSEDCAKRFPRFKDRLVLTDDAKVLGTALKSSLQSVPTDGGSPGASEPDAG